MKMSGGPASINIKIILLLSAAIIAAGTLYYTQYLVKQLQANESRIVEFYAKGIEYVANTSSPDADITFLFENIIKPIDFPLIITDKDDSINLEDHSGRKNVELDSTLSMEEQMVYLQNKIKEMDALHEPLTVTYADTIILQKIHYGESKIISQLRFYPYAQITIAALFIIIGYVGFSSIKRSEQGNIWVGMAKETAHQFGTPISSLMGWLEMLKLSYKDPDKVMDIADEIGNDVEKLNKITYRFSKIGATPEIKEKVVFDEIKKVTEYFQRRLPQTGKTIELTIDGDDKVCAGINSELFEWVIENLVKNALDAIEGKAGKIQIFVKDFHSRVEVEVKDSGKGIDMRRRKDVFRPGYSTKRRGWGLGLSLSKRIIEEYHKGKIFVKSSAPGEGTIFRIVLKKI